MSVPPLTVTAPQLRLPHRYIAIEGPIGVGKTTLVTLLAECWSMHTLFERPQDNPFKDIAARIGTSGPAPDLVVYLQASLEVLFSRIQKRALPMSARCRWNCKSPTRICAL